MESKALSKSQIDRLGNRLRTTDLTPELLYLLEEYRSEFSSAYIYVEKILTEKLFLKVTGRPEKSTLSIIEKLRRITARLSQIQDIAGCRVIAKSLSEQNDIIDGIRQWFKDVTIDDKRQTPTHGYRAVHLLINHQGKTVEIQVRTRAQHFWATASELVADQHGQEIKYGQGKPSIIKKLALLSKQAENLDKIVDLYFDLQEMADAAKRTKQMKPWKEYTKKIRTTEKDLRLSIHEINATISELHKE